MELEGIQKQEGEERIIIEKISPFGTVNEILRARNPVWKITIMTTPTLQQKIADIVWKNQGAITV